jgi:hypothetical protein
MQRLGGMMETLPDVQPPEGLGERVLQAIPAIPGRDRSLLGPSSRYLAAAAVVFFTFALLLGGQFRIGPPSNSRLVEIVFNAPEAGTVSVVGDFNDWDPARDTMARQDQDGLWKVQLRLRPGVYQYGFVIDGQRWSADPLADSFMADGFGGRNSVLFVEG